MLTELSFSCSLFCAFSFLHAVTLSKASEMSIAFFTEYNSLRVSKHNQKKSNLETAFFRPSSETGIGSEMARGEKRYPNWRFNKRGLFVSQVQLGKGSHFFSFV